MYSEIRGLTSSKGLDVVLPPELRCCSPGLRDVSDCLSRKDGCICTQAFCLCISNERAWSDVALGCGW